AEAQGIDAQRELQESGAVVVVGRIHAAIVPCGADGGSVAVDDIGYARPSPPPRIRMRILSFNANGLRSAASKGFFGWFAGRDVDVLCLQETKAQEHQLSDAVFRPAGYQAWFKDASTRKGYSGVAIYSRREPDEVRT